MKERLSGFWLRDENVLYVGKATSLRDRVKAYYSTKLGARRPHSGGWFIKTLSDFGELYVHYAAHEDALAAEETILRTFMASVSDETRSALHDPDLPLPFANLELRRGGPYKRHGIKGAREAKSRRVQQSTALSPIAKSVPTQPVGEGTTSSAIAISRSGGAGVTQRVTEADMGAGRIRIPVDSKPLFPLEKAQILVHLRGVEKTCRYDPRPGKSGVIGVGRDALANLVEPNEVLQISLVEEVYELS